MTSRRLSLILALVKTLVAPAVARLAVVAVAANQRASAVTRIWRMSRTKTVVSTPTHVVLAVVTRVAADATTDHVYYRFVSLDC